MDSFRTPAGEQDFKEPKRKKKIPGVVPNNPFPIIFWKKLGIPPCSDLWPCYNGLFDGEGVVFPSSEDISDIHSMGYFGRNVLEERGHDLSSKGIPLMRERQWRMMIKWATDFGYVITEQDGLEDDRKDDTASDEKGDRKGKSSKTRSKRERNADSAGFELEKKDMAVELNLGGNDEGGVMNTSNETVNISGEKSDVDRSEHPKISGVEKKDKSGEDNGNASGRVEENLNGARLREAENMKGKTVRKEVRQEKEREEEKEKRMINDNEVVSNEGKGNEEKGNEEKGNEEKAEEMEEVVEEGKLVSSEENPKVDEIVKGKEDNSILNAGKIENSNQTDNERVVMKDKVPIVSSPVNTEKITINSEAKSDTRVLEPAKESQEMGKMQNMDDFVEIIEEKSGTEDPENVNNVGSFKARILKRKFKDESCNSREKITKKNNLMCEENVILKRPSGEGSCKTNERKCSDEVLNSSGECEIVEIKDGNTYKKEGSGKEQNSETDDDIIVVSVDDGEYSLDCRSNSCKKEMFSRKLPKDLVHPLGQIQNQPTKNEGYKNRHNKYTYSKKNDRNAIEIDLHGKELSEDEKDLAKCDDVEELFRKGSRNSDDISIEESTASSLKSDSEVSPCIVIPDSDSEDEKGPQWESDPSFFLPSLEWLKLFAEEAFFLAYALGCVQVWDGREDEILQIKEKKQLKHEYPVVDVDSKSKKENPMSSVTSPQKFKSFDEKLHTVKCSDEIKVTASKLTPPVSNDGKTAGCDETVDDEKKNISSDNIERNVVGNEVVNGNDRLSPDKTRDNRTYSHIASEKICSRNSSYTNGSITVIDLVDSPPSHLVDKESSDDVDPGAECIDSKQVPGSIFNFHHKAMSLEELWNAFRMSRASQSSTPFETSYAVYHHFRSKGWVVKPGIRFGGDFLLYKDGPSFYHASYLVVIDSSLPHEASSITWNTLAGLNRLAENVAKELMICRVEWPESMTESQLWSPKCLDGLVVEEMLVKRWVSMKERDADDEDSDDDRNCDFIPLSL